MRLEKGFVARLEGSTHAKSTNLKSILENLNSHEDLGQGREWDHELFP